MEDAQDPCEELESPNSSCDRCQGCSPVFVGNLGSGKPMLAWGSEYHGLPPSLCHDDLEVALILASISESRGGCSSPMGASGPPADLLISAVLCGLNI